MKMQILSVVAAIAWNFFAWIGIISIILFIFFKIIERKERWEEKGRKDKLMQELLDLESDISMDGREIFSNMDEEKQRKEVHRMMDVIERAYIAIGLQDYR